ncbi:MAG: hypothetical protein ACTSYD_10120 [Candidatus Heimdallarchaeaceae archaeon]
MFNMKGISLPINALVIVAIAVIVLLGLVALYFGGFNPFSTAITVESAKNDACDTLVRYGCNVNTNTITIDDFDADQDGAIGAADTGSGFDWANPPASCKGSAINAIGDNLASLCFCFYNKKSEAECKALCGCPVVGV